MAIIQGTYLSDALKRSITYHVYLPNDTADEMKTEYYERPAKVLYLLIGYSGASIDWVTGSLIFGARAEIQCDGGYGFRRKTASI